jgi:hypothetical protein
MGSDYPEPCSSRRHVYVAALDRTVRFVLRRCTDYYYFATARGQKIWWKKYLTTMQITQFVIDIVAVYYGSTFFVPHHACLILTRLCSILVLCGQAVLEAVQPPDQGLLRRN